MNIEELDKLLGACDVNHSVMFPLLKNRLGIYKDHELPFPEEFLFFEDKYLIIKKHIIENNISTEIVDIGCQYGFQSEIFLDSPSYIGIDCQLHKFFNQDKENINYVVGLFPDVNVDIKEKTVISCMSLGYFNKLIDEDIKKANDIIARSLSVANTLYISSTEKLIKEASKYYKEKTMLYASKTGDYNMYVLSK